MTTRFIVPILFWTAVLLLPLLAGAFLAWSVAGDDLSPVAFIVILLPLLLTLALIVAALGAQASTRGRAPPWLALLVIVAEGTLVVSGGRVWQVWGEAIAFGDARVDLEPTVTELEAGRRPSRRFGGPQVLERGPPLRVTFKAGWHRFTYDGADRLVPGCLRVARRWSACPLF